MEVKQVVTEILKTKFPQGKIEILDPRNDGVHLEAVVVLAEFEGLSHLQRHRMVMEPLKELFQSSLHALSIKTQTPKEWEEGRE